MTHTHTSPQTHKTQHTTHNTRHSFGFISLFFRSLSIHHCLPFFKHFLYCAAQLGTFGLNLGAAYKNIIFASIILLLVSFFFSHSRVFTWEGQSIGRLAFFLFFILCLFYHIFNALFFLLLSLPHFFCLPSTFFFWSAKLALWFSFLVNIAALLCLCRDSIGNLEPTRNCLT